MSSNQVREIILKLFSDSFVALFSANRYKEKKFAFYSNLSNQLKYKLASDSLN
jgi:hypothetical protein